MRTLDDHSPVALSVIVPVYNEAATVAGLLELVYRAPYQKQIIIVDDGSADGTADIVRDWIDRHDRDPNVLSLSHASNLGKGAAIRTGLCRVRGKITLIQDADLEYDPRDYPALVEPVLTGRAEVVYGSRFLRRGNRSGRAMNRFCLILLNAAVWLLYGKRVTDEATCYKAFRTVLLRGLDLKCQRFEFCPEATAKLCRLGVPIHEVPIRYHPRSVAEGKKIGWRDAAQAFWTLLRWRFAAVKPLVDSVAPEPSELATHLGEAAI